MKSTLDTLIKNYKETFKEKTLKTIISKIETVQEAEKIMLEIDNEDMIEVLEKEYDEKFSWEDGYISYYNIDDHSCLLAISDGLRTSLEIVDIDSAIETIEEYRITYSNSFDDSDWDDE